jgi:hypothetical protein
MKTDLERTVKRWKADADQYQKQVDEARLKGLPHDQMLSMMSCLRACAKDVDGIITNIKELKPQ